jgi:hypothetical protein
VTAAPELKSTTPPMREHVCIGHGQALGMAWRGGFRSTGWAAEQRPSHVSSFVRVVGGLGPEGYQCFERCGVTYKPWVCFLSLTRTGPDAEPPDQLRVMVRRGVLLEAGCTAAV